MKMGWLEGMDSQLNMPLWVLSGKPYKILLGRKKSRMDKGKQYDEFGSGGSKHITSWTDPDDGLGLFA